MSDKPNILVTSAAGSTGIPTTLQLLEKDYPVRAFVHREDWRSKLLADAGAEIFVGNHFSMADMRRAMAGVRRAYHCAPAAPNVLHFGTVFATAAREAELEHVVMLGQWLSDSDHPSVGTREVWLNEQVLKMLPDTTLTVNNVGWFAENYFWVLEPVAQLGILPMPFGDGDVKKNAAPSNEDIAAVTVAALIDPQAHAGKTYRPTGPELLSPNEIAAAMGEVLGRKVKYLDISDAMMLKALKVQDFPQMMATQLRRYTDEYRRGAFAVHAPNNVVKEVTGRDPEDFKTIAERTIATRPEAARTIGNRLRAVANFLRLPMTGKVDADAIERRRDHALLTSPRFVGDSQTWRESHDPQAGYMPDQPHQAERHRPMVHQVSA